MFWLSNVFRRDGPNHDNLQNERVKPFAALFWRSAIESKRKFVEVSRPDSFRRQHLDESPAANVSKGRRHDEREEEVPKPFLLVD